MTDIGIGFAGPPGPSMTAEQLAKLDEASAKAASAVQPGQLTTALGAETTRAQAAEADLDEGIAQEAATRAAAVTSLDGRLDTVEAALPGKASSSALGAEVTRAQAAENALDGRLDAVEGALPGKASASGLSDEVDRAQDAEAALQDAVDAEAQTRAGAVSGLTERADAVDAIVDPLSDLVPRYDDRAGDARGLFSSSISGDPKARPVITAGITVANTVAGTVLRIRGEDTDDEAGYVDVAPRIAAPLYEGRTYRVTFRLRRNSNPTDPANNAVELHWQNLNYNKNAISVPPRLGPVLTPVEADGVLTRSFLIGKAGAPGPLDYTIPPTALYGLPVMRIFGNGHQTDAISIEPPEDVTDAILAQAGIGQAELDITALQADVSALGADISDEVERATGAEAALSNDIDAEAAIRAGQTAALDGRATSLEARAYVSEQQADLDRDLIEGARYPVTYGRQALQADENGLADLILTAEGIDGRFARPGSQRTPVTFGRAPVMIDQDTSSPMAIDAEGKFVLGALSSEPTAKMPITEGRVPVVVDPAGASIVSMDSAGRPVLAPMTSEPTLRTPISNGILPTEQTPDGEVLRGQFDGVPYDPGAAAQAAADPAGETMFNRKQLAVFDVDPGTLWPTRRVVTLSQQGDFEPLGALSPGLMRVKGPDPDYPIGIVGWRAPRPASNILYIIGKGGQSNTLGITGAADGSAPNPKFTVLASMPGQCFTFNAGPHPHQSSGGSGDVATPADPAGFTSFIDMKAGEYEGSGLGAAEMFAMASGAKVLLINTGFSGSSFNELVGQAGADAQPWTDFIGMINSAVAIAATMNLTPVIAGYIWNQGENNDSDEVAGYTANLNVLRAKVDALASLTGQSARIPIVACQPASTRSLNTGLPRPAALAIANWAASVSNYAVALPLYWTSMDDVATVHHRAQGHRHIDELSGHLLWDFATVSRARTLRMVSARRTGTLVTVTMSEVVAIDAKAVADPGSYGISYRDSTASRAVSGVKVDGNIITFRVTGPTGAGEVVSMGCHGAKKYPDLSNRDGMGRLYGLRSCIRSLRKYWSHTTGRPLWLWAQQQELNVSVSA